MKIKLIINEKETSDVLSVSWGRSLDNVVGSSTFSLPYCKNLKFEKFDAMQLYINDEIMMNGYISNRNWGVNKHGFSQTYTAYDKIGIAEIKNVPHDYSDGMLKDRIQNILKNAEIDVDVEFKILRDIPIQIPAKDNLLDFLKELRTKYGLWIYSKNDGNIIVQTPTWFSQNTINAWEFTYGENIISLDCSSSYNFIHTVIVIGNTEGGEDPKSSIGVAIDYISKEAFGEGNGTLIIHRNDLFGQEACEEVARNILIKKSTNATITIDVPFMPQVNVGDVCLIKNLSNEIPENRRWIVRSFQHSISKNNISTKLTLSASALLDTPSRIITGNTGILDRDMLV